jgi:copper chaperone CopZ
VNHYIHQIPGRLRIKSPILKNEKYHPEVRELLSTLRGVEAAELNPTTGSVTIFYDPGQVQGKEIEKAFQRHGYFDRSKAVTNDQYIHNAVAKAGQIVSRALFGSAAGVALEGTGLSFLTAII